MQEIEVKARVQNLALLIKKLTSLGCLLSDPVEQEDRIYINSDYTKLMKNPKRILLRIRTEPNRVLFTLKQHGSNELDSLEHEVEVSDAQQLEAILLLLGFHEEKVIRVNKSRRKTKYKDMEIVLDEVDHLGTFIEIEKQVSKVNPSQVQNELRQVLRQLGLEAEDEVTQGYDSLMRLQRSHH